MRYCENSFCIYQEENTCILNQISPDEYGICQDCIWVEIPREKKEEIKRKMREEFEERDRII